MNDAERIQWIDQASYYELLMKWRREPACSPWFMGDVGKHYADVMRKRKSETPIQEQVNASEEIGWEGGNGDE